MVMSSSETVACDFCNERTAVLFCRADTAKLCLPCDHHVHSANLLSRKHVRSQICDNCSREPVSVRCFTDNLVLCQECDWDVHGSCSSAAAHNRSAVEGFSGCPSVSELAAVWGLDLEGKKKEEGDELLDPWDSGSNIVQDLIVPYDMSMKRRNPSFGRYKQVVYKQLEELLKSGGDEVDGGGSVTQLSPTTSFTSLLMHLTEYHSPCGNGTQWNHGSGQATQVHLSLLIFMRLRNATI